jgi:rhamnopyranosyl-N-acetylglucosaminyl-diphospho-decaprenol beta-1,3/1,4-galactofuranosyltransferase
VSEKVCAVIVTYNREDLLRECLNAVLSQTRPPDHVLVVDNASTDGTPEMLEAEFPQVEVLRLPENQGGAGGFHEGMKRAYEMGFEWLWIMDDDAFPEKDALALLSRYFSQAEVLVPLQRDVGGSLYGVGYWKGRYVSAFVEEKASPFRIEMFAFVGPLIHREVLQKVGLPRKEFFLHFDDFEYALRIREAGLRVLCVPDSRIAHSYGELKEASFLGFFRRKRVVRSPIKVYYGMRNYGWTVCRTRLAKPRLMSLVMYFLLNLRWLVGDLLFEPDRFTRVRMRVKGVWHGILGKLGKLH